MPRILLALFTALLCFTSSYAQSERNSFETAIYIMKNSVNALADPDVAARVF